MFAPSLIKCTLSIMSPFGFAVERIKDRGIKRSNAWKRGLKMHRMKET